MGYNLTGKNIKTGIIVAMYDSDGCLISAETKKTQILAYSYDALEITDLSVPDNCVRIKWFLWDLDSIKPFKFKEEM